jgi:hypothetical protein
VQGANVLRADANHDERAIVRLAPNLQERTILKGHIAVTEQPLYGGRALHRSKDPPRTQSRGSSKSTAAFSVEGRHVSRRLDGATLREMKIISPDIPCRCRSRASPSVDILAVRGGHSHRYFHQPHPVLFPQLEHV